MRTLDHSIIVSPTKKGAQQPQALIFNFWKTGLQTRSLNLNYVILGKFNWIRGEKWSFKVDRQPFVSWIN